MANKGAIKTGKYPGVGWEPAGQNAAGAAQWRYTGTSRVYHASGGSGGSGGSRGGSGGTRNAKDAKTDAEKKAEAQARKDYTAHFYDVMGTEKYKPDKDLIEKAVKNKWSLSHYAEQLRLHDKAYVHTESARIMRDKFRTLVEQAFKGSGLSFAQILEKYPDIAKELKKYVTSDPGKGVSELNLRNIFRRVIMKNEHFKTRYPGFADYLKSSGATDAIGAWAKYDAAWQAANQAWRSTANGVGATTDIPLDLFNQYLSGGWTIGDDDWKRAIRGRPEYYGGTPSETPSGEPVPPAAPGEGPGAEPVNPAPGSPGHDAATYFQDMWNKIFKGTELEGSPVDKRMLSDFLASGLTFEDWWQNHYIDPDDPFQIKQILERTIPEFDDWASKRTEEGADASSLWGEDGYLARRAWYIDYYRGIMEDPTASPPADLLSQALAGNWSNTVWDLTIRKRPEYKQTKAYQNKGSEFDKNWRALFGENASPDANLREKFIENGGDFDALWQDIKGTQDFQANYGSWEDFAAGQLAAGGPMEGGHANPALYKQYARAFSDAFANEGLDPNQYAGLVGQFFRSGVSDQEFKSNIAEWGSGRQSYQWQTGQQADIVTASGIADKTAGGDLRKRLKTALDQHRVFASSKFEPFAVEKNKTDELVRKI